MMDRHGDRIIDAVSACVVIAFLGALAETVAYPAPGSAVMFVFALLAPPLAAVLVWRLSR